MRNMGFCQMTYIPDPSLVKPKPTLNNPKPLYTGPPTVFASYTIKGEWGERLPPPIISSSSITASPLPLPPSQPAVHQRGVLGQRPILRSRWGATPGVWLTGRHRGNRGLAHSGTGANRPLQVQIMPPPQPGAR